jgi:hypothetical protein
MGTLEAEGITAATTGEAIGVTRLLSSVALIDLFGTGFVATAGWHISRGYVVIARRARPGRGCGGDRAPGGRAPSHRRAGRAPGGVAGEAHPSRN